MPTITTKTVEIDSYHKTIIMYHNGFKPIVHPLDVVTAYSNDEYMYFKIGTTMYRLECQKNDIIRLTHKLKFNGIDVNFRPLYRKRVGKTI